MIERIFPAAPALSGTALDEELLRENFSRPAGGTWVSFNFVSSIDGAATVEGRSGKLGNADDQHLFQLMRRTADVILVGAQTVRAEGYGGELLSAGAQQWRKDHGLPAHPPLAIVSGSLNLDPALEVFTGAPVRPLVFTLASAPADRREALGEVADVVLAGADTLDVDALVGELAHRGMHRIHSEGGPTLLGTFQTARRVDELSVTVSPLLVGGLSKRIADVRPGTAPAGPQDMELAHILKSGSMLFLRYLRPAGR
ncbi:pyrimidine reductase family protein [Arthrobacter livingstonensis]|uniref:Pyrimidine reductase family protein n=1 Tax=Arthrobacter livingstonensis TaxID=670078 RepID=A0A2V5LND8_9MICC|nr:pyrimidine reductase family protein [Arthrobacter livingstonensis]PYI69290.1 pyrimidine reductase family protein [Arthrobacter livingstonensis]